MKLQKCMHFFGGDWTRDTWTLCFFSEWRNGFVCVQVLKGLCGMFVAHCCGSTSSERTLQRKISNVIPAAPVFETQW